MNQKAFPTNEKEAPNDGSPSNINYEYDESNVNKQDTNPEPKDTLYDAEDQGVSDENAPFTAEELTDLTEKKWSAQELELDAEDVTARICEGKKLSNGNRLPPYLEVTCGEEKMTQALTAHASKGGHKYLHHPCARFLLIGAEASSIHEVLMLADFLLERSPAKASNEIKRELGYYFNKADKTFTPKLRKDMLWQVANAKEKGHANAEQFEAQVERLLKVRYGGKVDMALPDTSQDSWKGRVRLAVVAAASKKPESIPAPMKNVKLSPAEVLGPIFGESLICVLDGPNGTTAQPVRASDLKDLPGGGKDLEFFVAKKLGPSPWTTAAGDKWTKQNEWKTEHSLKANPNFPEWPDHIVTAELDTNPWQTLAKELEKETVGADWLKEEKELVKSRAAVYDKRAADDESAIAIIKELGGEDASTEDAIKAIKDKTARMHRGMQWQLLHWISDQIGQTPLYICRSGGKSLHAAWDGRGWTSEEIKLLFQLLFACGFDSVTGNRSQKVRVPGGRRSGNGARQTIVWHRELPEELPDTKLLHAAAEKWLGGDAGNGDGDGALMALPRALEPPEPPRFDSLKAFSDWHEEHGGRLTEETCLQVAGANSKIMYVETPLNAWLSGHYGLADEAMPIAAFRGLANAADVRRQSQLARWLVSTGDYYWCDNRYYKAKPSLGVVHIDKDGLEAELKAGGVNNTGVVAAFKTAVRTHFGASAVAPRHFASQGISEVNGKRLLNSSEVYLVPPAGKHSGKWADGFPLIAGLMDSLFREQRDYFNQWLAHLVRSCYAGEPKAGLAMMLLGPKSAGKKALRVGILQQMFLGGGMVDAGSYLSGETHFNARLGEAVFAFASDFPVEGKNIDKFGARVKELVGEARIVVEKKGIDSIEVEQPCVRALVFANADEKSLKGVPKLTENTEDKVALLRMHLPPGVTVAAHPEDHELKPEIPSFVAYLLSSACDVPEGQKCPRFGLTVMHDSELLEKTIEAHDDGLLGLIEGVADDMSARWDDAQWEEYFSMRCGLGRVIWEEGSRYLLVNDQALYDLLLHKGSDYAKARIRKPSEVKNALTDVIVSHRGGLIQRVRRRLNGKRVLGYLIKISNFDPSPDDEIDETP